MKKILSILLVSVILFSCSDSEIRYHIDETTSPTDTLTFLKLDMTPLNGMVYCEFGDNGFYINGKRDGEHKRWYDNGQLRDLGNYDNGIFVNYKGWFENGNQYIHNVPIKDSISEVMEWYESGQLKTKYNKNGWVKEGEYKEWYENGNVRLISNYKNNKLDGFYKYSFDESGDYITFNYKNDIKDGINEYYRPNKVINKTITLWENDIKITVTEFWDNIKYKVTYFKDSKKIKSEIGKNDIRTIFYDENENEIK